MEGEQTEYIWGVIDFTPETDFPDIRNKCVIHSNNGTCMVIPREGDKIRLYIQLDSKNGADTSTMKRFDKSQMSPHQLFDVCTTPLPFLYIETRKNWKYHSYIFGTGGSEIISALHFPNTRVF